MAHPRGLRPFRLPLTVDGVPVDIGGLHRDGTGTPLVFLHGFGSTKEDYADVVHQAALADRPVRAYDAPGCGATICPDRVELSDSGGLMERFLALPFPRMFVYGAQISALSYLGELTENGVELAEIPHSGHFPMYSNPPEMWSRITDFVVRADAREER